MCKLSALIETVRFSCKEEDFLNMEKTFKESLKIQYKRLEIVLKDLDKIDNELRVLDDNFNNNPVFTAVYNAIPYVYKAMEFLNDGCTRSQ